MTGAYEVTLTGAIAEEIRFNVCYLDEIAPEEQGVWLYYPGYPMQLTVTFNPSGSPKIEVQSPFSVPVGVQTQPYDDQGAQKTRITWTPVTGNGLAGYRIYVRGENDPVFTLLDEVGPTETEYFTDDGWGYPGMIYMVTAYNTLGEESFLSESVQNQSQTIAQFSANKLSGPAPLSVQFSNQSTGAITGWQWDFGDGATSTGQNPSHTYTAAGSYTVKLTVTGADGSDIAIQPAYITVSNPPPAPARLSNISTRGDVGTGGHIMIGGFIITGSSERRVVMKCMGPSLTGFGVRMPCPTP